MLPMPRFTKVSGMSLDKIISQDKANELAARTINRGKEIVSLFGSGSAYFAPSAAIAQLAGVIARGKAQVLGVSAYLNGEYGIKDACIGVPCMLGRSGIEKVIELELNVEELADLQACAARLKEQYKEIK